MELTIEHLAPYLPYGLKFSHFDDDREIKSVCEFNGISNDEICLINSDYEYWINISDCIPIMRPISDLFNPELNPVPINKLKGIYGWDYLWEDVYTDKQPFNIHALKWGCISKILPQHFDVFGLIEKGLAIDINTLNKQP